MLCGRGTNGESVVIVIVAVYALFVLAIVCWPLLYAFTWDRLRICRYKSSRESKFGFVLSFTGSWVFVVGQYTWDGRRGLGALS